MMLYDMREICLKQVEKARKDYTCGECHRTITAGERYEYVWGVWVKESVVYRACLHCVSARDVMLRYMDDEEFAYRGVLRDMEETFRCNGGMELGRLVIGMRRQWRDRNGNLMQVPGKG